MQKYDGSWPNLSLNNFIHLSTNFCGPTKNLESTVVNKIDIATAFMETAE